MTCVSKIASVCPTFYIWNLALKFMIYHSYFQLFLTSRLVANV